MGLSSTAIRAAELHYYALNLSLTFYLVSFIEEVLFCTGYAFHVQMYFDYTWQAMLN